MNLYYLLTDSHYQLKESEKMIYASIHKSTEIIEKKILWIFSKLRTKGIFFFFLFTHPHVIKAWHLISISTRGGFCFIQCFFFQNRKLYWNYNSVWFLQFVLHFGFSFFFFFFLLRFNLEIWKEMKKKKFGE